MDDTSPPKEVDAETAKAIRAEERFRMALFTMDAALAMEKAAGPVAMMDKRAQAIVGIVKAHAQDMMVSGEAFSTAIDLAPSHVKEQLLMRRMVAEAAVSDLHAAEAAEAMEAAQPGYVQLELEIGDDEPGRGGGGDGNEGSGFLN